MIAIIPFVLFIARRESPPEKIKVESHRQQVIKQFRLESRDKIEWELTSPEAKFKGENTISLKNPLLLVKTASRTVTIKAPYALFYRKQKRVKLKQVFLETDNLTAQSPCGIYDVNSGTFTTDCGCKISLRKVNTITGKICILNLNERKITVSNGVKSIFREVKK